MNSYRNTLEKWWSHITFSKPQRRSLLALSMIVIATSAFFVLRGTSEPIQAMVPDLGLNENTAQASSQASSQVSSQVSAQVVVDVAGAVKTPGVYSLPINSRVIDALKAAGNILKGADLSDINLARILKDGEQVYIYPPNKVGSTARTSPQRAKVKASGPIALNRASAKELEKLDGVGPVLAARIVAYRNQNGPFLTTEDLLKVSGIGAFKYSQLKDKLRV